MGAGPSIAGTIPQRNRLHDDRSTYTGDDAGEISDHGVIYFPICCVTSGVHVAGGPSTKSNLLFMQHAVLY